VQAVPVAGLADLTLDPVRLTMDLSLPLLGSGSSADTRRGMYRFPAKTEPAPVALKLFRLGGGHTASRAVRDLIVQEMRVGARLQHENVIQMFGTIEIPGHGMVLMMELASGGSLRDVLADRQAHPSIGWPLRLRWLADIAQGMAKLHALLPRAIIHRDLKSANVLLSSADPESATAKICDFGLAKAAETVRTLASGGGLAGSLPWKAPETFRDRYTTKSDVYGFGVVGFEVVSRCLPFQGIGEPAIFEKVRTMFDPQEKLVLRRVDRGESVEEQRLEWLGDKPLDDRRPDLSLAEPGCPAALCALIRRCWADEPIERPEFSECLSALKAVKPLRTFATSHFKREYDGTIPITQASQVFASVADFVHMYCQVHGFVSAEQTVLQRQFVQLLVRQTGAKPGVDPLGDVGVTAELLWTSSLRMEGMGDERNKELCNLVNAAIRTDHAELMPSTARLARSINTLCVVRCAGAGRAEFPADGITFRGTGFDHRYRPFFDSAPNKKYRVPGFLATSFSEATARDFAYNNGTAFGRPAVLWVVHVDPRGRDDAAHRCKHVNFVRHALVEGEHEYLFTAYSVFTVRRCVWADGDEPSRIEIDAALDNLTEREDLPLAPWY
jgi:serine/threonine protein kinase